YIRLNFCEDIIEQVVVVDFRIKMPWRIPQYRSTDHPDARLIIVYRWFPFCQYDEAWPKLVEPGIHSTGYFLTTGKRQANVDIFIHPICHKSMINSIFDKFPFWNFMEGKRFRRILQPLKMVIKSKNPVFIYAQSFPYCIATLDTAVENGDFCFVPGKKASAHPDLDILISGIKLLQHNLCGL